MADDSAAISPPSEVRRSRSFGHLHMQEQLSEVCREAAVLPLDGMFYDQVGRLQQRRDRDHEHAIAIAMPATHVSSDLAEALSLERPRYDGAVTVPNLTRRRVRSFESGGGGIYMDSSSVGLRSRAYTKSLGTLVKHLAPPVADHEKDDDALGKPAVNAPRMSICMRLLGWFSRIWKPRDDIEIPVVDYPLKHEFALILHNKPTEPRVLARNGLDAVGKQQLQVIRRCIAAGLEVSVLSSSLYTRKYMVLLLRPTAARLQIERNRLVLERWLQIGAVGEVPSEIEQLIADSHIGASSMSPHHVENEVVEDELESSAGPPNDDDTKFTPAERLQTIARIITSTANVDQLNPPGAEISLDETNSSEDSIIHSCFPLHNRRANAMLLSKCTQWWWRSDEITKDIRYYHGERVAFYFSFVFVYTKWLLLPSIIGAAIYFSLRWYGAVEYMRALCCFGFAMVTIWGALCLKAWTRQNNYLNDAWNLRLFKEAEYPNASFRPQGYREVVDSNGMLLFREPFYSSWRRFPAYIQTLVVFAIFIGTYIVGISFFVQWYTAAMLTPTCSECPECISFLSCFHTKRPILLSGRWFFILVQGVLLGISLDIFVYLLSVKLLHFFVVRENHATEAHFQRAMTTRLFGINWISFFLWFILIAFVVVPFGEDVEKWVREKLDFRLLTVNWKNGVIDMSTALVTPLLITQALNLLIDTAVPRLLRRGTLSASRVASKIMRANPAETLLALSEYQSSFENWSADNPPTSSPSGSLGFKAKIEMQMLTPTRIPYIEKELDVVIPTLEGFDNDKDFMTADDVLEESQLDKYNAFPDYLRMVIQYGYVVMFSVVWPFCALCGLANNFVHIQNGFSKLCDLRRRPVPRKANSIGQWERMLFITLMLGIFVVAGLICLSSGELEFFLPQCTERERFKGTEFSMNPDFSCLDISTRLFVALALEHVALLLIYLLLDNVSDTPEAVRTSFQRKKELIRRAICGHSTNVPIPRASPTTRAV